MVADRLKEMLPRAAKNFISNKEISGFMRAYDVALKERQERQC